MPQSWLDSPFVVRDVHISTLLPRQVRGDHYHVARNEILIVPSGVRWSLFFDAGPGTEPRRQEFTGVRAVVIAIPTQLSHAIRNDGATAMNIVGLTSDPYDPAAPDAFTRRVSTIG